MKLLRIVLLSTTFMMLFSCISTRNTVRNIDNNVAGPELDAANNSFIITKMATDKKYAYTENYPVNVGFTSIENGLTNQMRFLNALAGPKGEKISYKLVNTCCPYPSKRSDMGAGMLDVFEITYTGQTKPTYVYVNKYDRGELMIPVGLTARKYTSKRSK